MYLLEQDFEPMKISTLGRILNDFQMKELPRLQRFYNYYKGKQAITLKQASDVGKPCNKIVTNYCRTIADNFEGYLTGVGIQYSNDKIDISPILDVLNWNDVKTEDADLLRQALIFGRAFEICYIDELGNQRFRTLDPRQCIPVYDNTLNNDLLYVIRFWKEDLMDENTESYIVEVYGGYDIKRYRSAPGFSSFQLLSAERHYYGQCPISVFSLNPEEESIFADIMSLQDAYNSLLSGEIDDFDSFADAYLILKGTVADDEDLENMKTHRVLMMDADASAEYLTKSISDTQIVDMLQRVNDNIHKIANCPDFSQESFGTSSGIALRYRLLGFENTAAAIESRMKKALQRRIELIASILKLTLGDGAWRDIQITFTRNIPQNITETVQIVNQLRGVVSDETLLTQIPFVSDVEKEIEKLQAQKEANLALYNFSNEEEVENEDEADE